MKINKITKKIEKYGQKQYELGSTEGWVDGYAMGYERGGDDHKETMSFRLNLAYDTAMASNDFRRAKWIKEIVEYLEFEFNPDVLETLDNEY